MVNGGVPAKCPQQIWHFFPAQISTVVLDNQMIKGVIPRVIYNTKYYTKTSQDPIIMNDRVICDLDLVKIEESLDHSQDKLFTNSKLLC